MANSEKFWFLGLKEFYRYNQGWMLGEANEVVVWGSPYECFTLSFVKKFINSSRAAYNKFWSKPYVYKNEAKIM